MANGQCNESSQVLRCEFYLERCFVFNLNVLRFAFFTHQLDVNVGRCLRDAKVSLTRENPYTVANVNIWVCTSETVELDVLV